MLIIYCIKYKNVEVKINKIECIILCIFIVDMGIALTLCTKRWGDGFDFLCRIFEDIECSYAISSIKTQIKKESISSLSLIFFLLYLFHTIHHNHTHHVLIQHHLLTEVQLFHLTPFYLQCYHI